MCNPEKKESMSNVDKEQVCEWKYWCSGAFYETCCGKNVVYTHDGDEEFKYCPYCGRKIKIKSSESLTG